MADRQTYLNNTQEPIAAQKRQEEELSGGSLPGALGMVGGLAAFIILRKKINLSRSFSKEIRSLGKTAPKTLDRYLVTELLRDKNASPIKSFSAWAKNIAQSATKSIPTVDEQLQIARQRLVNRGINFSGILPSRVDKDTRAWSAWRQVMGGPAVASIAPKTPLLLPGMRLGSGNMGSVFAGGHLLQLDKTGNIERVISGVRAGISGTSGERIEYIRTFDNLIKKHGTVEEMVRNVFAPLERDMITEHKINFAEEYLNSNLKFQEKILKSGKKIKGGATRTLYGEDAPREDVLKVLSDELDQHYGDGAFGFFRRHEASITEQRNKALNSIVSEQLKNPAYKGLFNIYNAQFKAGFGEPFAAHGSGIIQKRWRETRESLGMVIEDPLLKVKYPVNPRSYTPHGTSITGFWSPGVKGEYFLYPAKGSVKREILDFTEGTFFKTLEDTTGMGVSAAHNPFTKWISSVVGARENSYGDFFIRRYVGGFGRLAVLGAGGYTTFKLIDFMARQTTGWGVTDVYGKMYTSAREFQQHVIDAAGLVDFAKNTEKAFPGMWKSPLSMVARATAPYWMTRLGAKVSGRRGARLGLALGIATALITWGDITQSPEELHNIYTGEQDIPVRKGRYWMLGKTPLGGGKISYWRPHWYPMLRSHYKYKGQLWDSETEELANSGPLSPILSPLLTGKIWDPYAWEKKHYKDRPYPLTAEMFEPTAPFAWLGNLTIGNLIKPQRAMHPEYWGSAQGEPNNSTTIIPGSAASLGYKSPGREGMVGVNDPRSLGWQAGLGAYTLSEQMGLRGFFVNSVTERLTGRSNYLPNGPVIQSASSAMGFERSYWDWNLGDPGDMSGSGFTEFLRRLLPHRRRAVEDYNPIPNTMPDWMPGEDYFKNFKIGDPYTKVEMGEARLPGAGYESLHHLHSGIPGVYDAVDRFMILSDIAPYSNEYKHYRYLAQSMVRKEPEWKTKYEAHIEQRRKTQQEYEFLELNPPEDVPALLKPFSYVWRQALAGVTGAGEALDPVIGQVLFKSPIPFVASPISKFLPYKTAIQTYKDYRLSGSEFTDWGHPVRDFVKPWLNKVEDIFSNSTLVTDDEKKRREYEEYFDRLQYVKSKRLQKLAESAGEDSIAGQFGSMAGRTLTGVDPYGNIAKMMTSLPKRERAFFDEFSNADPSQREQIESMVSPQMANIYRAQWAKREGNFRARIANPSEDTENFFNTHYTPGDNWEGWNPEVDIKDVQLKVVNNEGMNIHGFDLWESQQRSMARRHGIPTIDNIHQPGDVEMVRRALQRQLTNDGYRTSNIFSTKTPSRENSVNIKVKLKHNNSQDREQTMRSLMYA